MRVNQKPTGTAKSVPIGLVIGWGVEMAVTMAMCCLLSVTILNGKLQWEAAGYGVMAMLLIASFSGASVSCRTIKRQKMMVCIISGVIYMGTLLGITILFFGGQFSAVGVTALLIAAGCTAAALVHCNEKHGTTAKRRKHKL